MPDCLAFGVGRLVLNSDDWVGVVDRAIQVGGEDHVALGSDFDGGPTPARHVRDIRDLATIADPMLRRGYSKDRASGSSWRQPDARFPSVTSRTGL
jgi:microsomal dipeptidase-like Zn-dependent dipeptidase